MGWYENFNPISTEVYRAGRMAAREHYMLVDKKIINEYPLPGNPYPAPTFEERLKETLQAKTHGVWNWGWCEGIPI
jgi:hypothetical protein